MLELFGLVRSGAGRAVNMCMFRVIGVNPSVLVLCGFPGIGNIRAGDISGCRDDGGRGDYFVFPFALLYPKPLLHLRCRPAFLFVRLRK